MTGQTTFQKNSLCRIGIRSVLFLMALLLFCGLAFFVMRDGITPLDRSLCAKVYALRSDALTGILTPLTYLANWQSITLFCVILLFFQRSRRHFGVPLTVASIASTLLYEMLKRVFERPRPDLSLHLIDQGGFSFPSGHSMTGLVFYGILIVLIWHHVDSRKACIALTALLALLIAAIGFSRIYLGVHYPTDVLGGWALGFCVALSFSGELERRWETRRKYAI